jgi:hypothetical protein
MTHGASDYRYKRNWDNSVVDGRAKYAVLKVNNE